MQSKKLIPGLDVMKFIMAFLIVDIHVKGYLITPPIIQQYIILPIEGLAVPEFFIISSFLFFSKMRRSNNDPQVLFHFWHRLVLLYLFWTIVWSPIILMQKPYLHEGAGSLLHFVLDFFFGNTFDASWFLGALIVGVPIVFGLSKILEERMVWILPFLVYIYLHYHTRLPAAWQVPYNFYNSFKDPNLAFPGGLLWIAIGYHLSNEHIVNRIASIRNGYFWVALLVGLISYSVGIFPMYLLIVCVTLLFMAAYTWKLPTENLMIYKRLRAYSILFYVIHDSFKKIPKYLFSNIHNGPLLYVITLIVCWLSSEFIIRMRNVRGFHWLKYAY